MDDIRKLQISFQLVLITIGYYIGYIQKSIFESIFIVSLGLLFQFLIIDKKKIGFNWKSPLITSLSLILLLKSTHIMFWPLISFISISSKKIIKYRDKHILNPSLAGIIFALMFLRDYIWLTPGAWGEELIVFFTFLICGMYLLFNVVTKYVLFGFMGSYFSFLLLRMTYLGDPFSIYTHQISNISFMLFIFFMISDPKTSPRGAIKQLVYGFLIAAFSYYFKFFHFKPYFLYYALLCSTIFLPFLREINFNKFKGYQHV